MSTFNKLKALQKEFSFCGTEENFTNYCFRYGVIVNEFRNDVEREVHFIIDGISASVVMQLGVTTTVRINNKN